MEHLFDTRPERPGYRLHRVEVFNWGTFDSTAGHVYQFEPEGRTSLLVGDNGSGKSTLVDAILTLLVDSRTRNYNVAAGAKKTERTPKSYIRGAYDRTADDTLSNVAKYLRPQGTHLTSLAAVFCDETLGKSFTLCQVLYLLADGSDDKVFAIADESRALREDLSGLRRSDEIRDHLKQLGYQTTKTYVEYHGWLKSRTQMHDKAMDMFNQTVAVKDIQNLNTFIRRHMLEYHNWRDKVQRLLAHFNDLSVAHQELVRARKAEELLTPVEKIGRKYRRQAEQYQKLEKELAASELFFPTQIIRLFDPEIDEQKRKLQTMVSTIERLTKELNEKREKIRQLKNEIDQAGGDRLRQIPSLIKVEEAKLDSKKATFARFHDHLKTCRIKDEVASPALFDRVREQLHTIMKSSGEQVGKLTPQQEKEVNRRENVQKQLSEERSELEFLQQRRTNLPIRFTVVRSRICNELNLDEADLPFAAELISVLSAEHQWEASIEMVLRPFAVSLLVPKRHYQRVRSYIENHRLTDSRGIGQRLDYICVGKNAETGGDRIHPQSLLHKLQFKPRHSLAPWIRGEILRRFNFRCCDSVEEFNDISRMAMTQNRHVKFSNERHKKDDRPHTCDPRHFVLGWDNTQKKQRIAERIGELEKELEAIQNSIEKYRRKIEGLQSSQRAAGEALKVTDFDAIDMKKHQMEINSLQEEKGQLEESNDTVQTLRRQLKVVENEEATIDKQRDSFLEDKGKLENEIKRVNGIVEEARTEVQRAKDSGEFERHAGMFDAITESLGEPLLSTVDLFQRRDQWKKTTHQRIKDVEKRLLDSHERLVTEMSRFLGEFKEKKVDLDASVDALDSFLGLLKQLRREDLPRYEKKFKNRLNDQVSQEIAFFNTELRLEGKKIEDKIAQLNKALAAVEYNRGTYMHLEPRPVKDREVEEFRLSLRECLAESLEHTDEANEARFQRIQKLVERLGDKERTSWRNKVIDVRNWYTFSAREVERDSQTTRGCYDGSSGQSGGEKAKLAFTILVAALAYQFDIDPHGNTSGRFQFVVVDEMFSKVDDQNAQYALKLFKQFGLQLLIVAPLDAKVRVTEPFVDRYLHVVKDPDTHHSQLYCMTAQEYEESVKSFSGNGKPSSNRRTVPN